jgi:hypothetical protein
MRHRLYLVIAGLDPAICIGRRRRSWVSTYNRSSSFHIVKGWGESAGALGGCDKEQMTLSPKGRAEAVL